MKVNKTTMEIEDLGEYSKTLLLKDTDTIVYNGKITSYYRKAFEEWRVLCDLSEDQGLVCMSTVFPLRVYSYMIKEVERHLKKIKIDK